MQEKFGCKKPLGENAKLQQMLNSEIGNQKSEIKSCPHSILSPKWTNRKSITRSIKHAKNWLRDSILKGARLRSLTRKIKSRSRPRTPIGYAVCVRLSSAN